MNKTARSAAKAAFDRILVDPKPADLWQLQKALVVIGGEPAERARAVARAFHACLRNLESKSASRSASRWGAVLGTAAVASVSIDELADTTESALSRLLQSGVPAALEVGSAMKSAQAWEVEAGLIYDDLAWFLYDELWDVSSTARPELSTNDPRPRDRPGHRSAARRHRARRRSGGHRGRRLPRGPGGARSAAARPTEASDEVGGQVGRRKRLAAALAAASPQRNQLPSIGVSSPRGVSHVQVKTPLMASGTTPGNPPSRGASSPRGMSTSSARPAAPWPSTRMSTVVLPSTFVSQRGPAPPSDSVYNSKKR